MTISGDCSIAGLGLSLTDRQTLISNINVIFHAAATIKFDENLKLAVDINVHGTKDIIQLGKEMTQLKVNIKSLTFIRYLHVSCFLSFSSYFFLLHSKVFKVNYNINATSISYFFFPPPPSPCLVFHSCINGILKLSSRYGGGEILRLLNRI